MRRNIVIIGIIISAIAVFMILTGVGGQIEQQNIMWDKLYETTQQYYNIQQQYFTYEAMAGFGFIFLIIGIPITLIGLVLKSKEQKKTVTDCYCPNCGRSIPFDAKICPYCKKDFEQSNKV